MVLSLAEMSLGGALLTVVIVMLRRLLLNRLPKKMFLAMWAICLFCFLVPVRIAAPVSIYQLLNDPEAFHNDKQTDAGPGLSGALPYAAEGSAIWEQGTADGSDSFSGSTAGTSVIETAKAEAAGESHTGRVIFAVWCAGVLILVSVITAGHIRGMKKYKMALPIHLLPEGFGAVFPWLAAHPIRRNVQVKYLDQIDTPLTYGIFKPVILLPKHMDWNDRQRVGFVLAHEMAHIRRFDGISKGLLAAALCIHWFNPMVWVMYVFANRDLELACDEAVLQKYGSSVKAEYALALVGMEEKRLGFVPMTSCFCKNALKERITSIMKSKPRSVLKSAAACLIVVLAACGFATAGGAKEGSGASVYEGFGDLQKGTADESAQGAEESAAQEILDDIISRENMDYLGHMLIDSKDSYGADGATSGEVPYTQEQYDQLIDGFYVDDYENMSIAQFNRTIYEKFSNDEELSGLFYTYADVLPENDPYGAYLNMTVQASLNEYESRLSEVYSGETVNPQVYRYFQKVVQADVFGGQVPAGGYYVEYMFSYRILDQDYLTVKERDGFLNVISSQLEAAAKELNIREGMEEKLQASFEDLGEKASNAKIKFIDGQILYIGNY